VLISSIRDTQIPVAYQKMVFDVYAGPHFPVSVNGNHGTPPDQSPQYSAALDWLWTQLHLPPVPPTTRPVTAPTHEFAG
jgi:hypothetical protein